MRTAVVLGAGGLTGQAFHLGVLTAGLSAADQAALLHGPGWPGTRLQICAVQAGDAQRVVLGTPGAPTTAVGTASPSER